MKLKDLRLETLLVDPDPELTKQRDEEEQAAFLEMFGDVSQYYPQDRLTKQGGGDGVYIIDPESQREYAEIYKKFVSFCETAGAKIVSEPLDPSGEDVYLLANSKNYIIDSPALFYNVIKNANGFHFSPKTDGTIELYVGIKKIYNKLGDVKNEELERNIILYSPRRDPYTPLDMAAIEEIFYNDTGLEYDPNKYSADCIKRIVTIKDYCDYLTNEDLDEDDPEKGRGGVDDIRYDSKTNTATVKCLINDISSVRSDMKALYNTRPYNELIPYLFGADKIKVLPGFTTQFRSLIWLVFSVSGIKK